ncbi:MAG: hypothetical protein WCA38_08000 [Candidatus Acidiferrales bacterium]
MRTGLAHYRRNATQMSADIPSSLALDTNRCPGLGSRGSGVRPDERHTGGGEILESPYTA